MTVTGSDGRLLANERLAVAAGALTISHRISPSGPVWRCKVVLLDGDRVLESARIDRP